MSLAMAEIRRAKVRFALLVVAVALLVFLILFQQTLQNGLVTAFVGAVRNQDAAVLVYSVDGRRTVQASIITPTLEAEARRTPGVAAVARIGQGTFSVTVRSGGRDQLADAAVIGIDGAVGVPRDLVAGRRPRADGEVVASDADRDDGFGIGATVKVEPGGYTMRVVGLARDTQLFAQPSLSGSWATYTAAVQARNPDAATPLPNVLAIDPAPGVSPAALARSVNDRSAELDALTTSDAADLTPGVAQVRQSFAVIFLLYGLVVPLVTGLFFLIVTIQKASALTLLHALGASTRSLVGVLVRQVFVVMVAGIALGVAMYTPLTLGRAGKITLRFETTGVIAWSLGLLVLGVVSSAFSARLVLRIDPATAMTGSGPAL